MVDFKLFITDKEMGTCCSEHPIDFYLSRVEEVPLTNYGKEIKCLVNRVLDGDTIEICYFFPFTDKGLYENIQRKRLRLFGIDSPEIHTKDEVEKEHALKSKTFLESLILNKLVLVKFMKNEKFGRELGNIYFDKKNINQIMLDKGFAREYHGEKKERWNF